MWEIKISRDAEKFLKKNNLTVEQIDNLVAEAIRCFKGEDVVVDIKKLKGEWKGFYRIRSGKIRIVAEFDFCNSSVFVKAIDFRGNVYK
jgi:mRNA interferase RelE/StbE